MPTVPHDSLPAEPHRFTNRLIAETSPYLLQHAHNPVDWYPWGKAAFDAAREHNRPIFLSVGYSACHWCHVMEHESFEDEQIAKLMNEHFINIKVDREERPDVDQIYMTSVQLITGRGGWPMSVFLDHDGKPFYGGTYWPSQSRHGMPSFPEILTKISQIWHQHPDDVEKASADLSSEIQRLSAPEWQSSAINAVMLENAVVPILKSADHRHGGFGNAPKFPHSMDLAVLMRHEKRFPEPAARQPSEALRVVTLTLDKMAAGGIYDHLGGGFARYSTDAYWLVPHFEKMLYDNALLLGCYVEAFQLTGNAEYAEVAHEICEYILRDMTSPEGGFYATEDADSEGVEGKFYVWSEDEIDEHLGAGEAGRIFKQVYDVTAQGNWEHSNILNRTKSWSQFAEELSLPLEDLKSKMACARAELFEIRSRRIPPGKDTKILTSWNGLMLASLARASLTLGKPQYAEAALKCAHFLIETMLDEDGRLLHSFKDGQARFNGYLDDYACFIDGLVETYQVTGEVKLLEAARSLAQRMCQQFADPDNGTFYFTSADHEQLIARQQEVQDNATPSGFSMAVTALLKLGHLLNDHHLESAGMKALEAAGALIKSRPFAVGQLLCAADFALGPVWELVLFPGDDPQQRQQALQAIGRVFLPNRLLMIAPTSGDISLQPDFLRPHFEGRSAINNQPTLYICQRGTCQQPLVGLEQITRELSGL